VTVPKTAAHFFGTVFSPTVIVAIVCAEEISVLVGESGAMGKNSMEKIEKFEKKNEILKYFRICVGFI